VQIFRIYEHSSDGKLLAPWSNYASDFWLWGTRTRQLVFKFPMSEVYRIALSPAWIEYPLATDSLLLGSHTRTRFAFLVCIPVICTRISWVKQEHTRRQYGGTVLAYYSFNFGMGILDIADLMVEYRKPTHGYTQMLQGMTDGWVMSQDVEPWFWVPDEHRTHLYVPPESAWICGR